MQLTPEQRKAIEQQKEQCPFCKIVKGEIPAKKVWEDDTLIAILDINPAQEGHVLLLPKEHYPIMPFIPPETFTHIFKTVREMTHYLRKALLKENIVVLVANGQAAGQQSSHFLLHLIPYDGNTPSYFDFPEVDQLDNYEQATQILSQNLNAMMGERRKLFPIKKQPLAPSTSEPTQISQAPSELAEMIQANPSFKKMLMEKPQAVLAGIEENPSLKSLFEGVDVYALSKRLKELEPHTKSDISSQEVEQEEDIPKARLLSDTQLKEYIDEKEKLRSLLLNNIDVLHTAIESQPKLQIFFEATSPEEVARRYANSVTISGGSRW